MVVLLAGGAGYIGCHAAVELLQAGHEVIIADNFSNSSPDVIPLIEKTAGGKVRCYRVDLRKKNEILGIFASNKIDCVVHLAGKKSVSATGRESFACYRTNIEATYMLLDCMKTAGVRKLVCASTSSVYGRAAILPFQETMRRGDCTTPHAWTNFMMEMIIEDACASDSTMAAVLLRIFSPIGCHPSGLLGENPDGIHNTLLYHICMSAAGRKPLTVYGTGFPTPDGTCMRDYFHVCDLGKGIVKSCEYAIGHTGCAAFNMASGSAVSVNELVFAFEAANCVNIDRIAGPMRAGDLPIVRADMSMTKSVLGWEPELSIADMCRDSWNWYKSVHRV